VDVHLYVHLSETDAKLDSILAALKKLQTTENQMSQALDDLTAEVTRVQTVDASVMTLLQGLTAKIQELIAAGNLDPQLQALHDNLKAQTDALAEAVTANTPAA
jgi:ABC-type transporter Mla MlaB component